MPNNQEFKASFSRLYTSPVVLMQPVDDLKAGHNLVRSILEHRISTILLARGFCPQERTSSREELENRFNNQTAELKRWAWPKTSDTAHSSKRGDDKNQTAYSPSPSSKEDSTVASRCWNSFVSNLDTSAPNVGEKRLELFRRSSATKKVDLPQSTIVPRIERVDTEALSLTEARLPQMTWRNLLLGEEQEGGPSWKKAIEYERAKKLDRMALP